GFMRRRSRSIYGGPSLLVRRHHNARPRRRRPLPVPGRNQTWRRSSRGWRGIPSRPNGYRAAKALTIGEINYKSSDSGVTLIIHCTSVDQCVLVTVVFILYAGGASNVPAPVIS